jgi:hypothetical protein
MADSCIRRAWLTLGSLSIDLENPDAGYFCTSLDLGFPEPREVTNNRPDQDGIDDRTRFMGGRVISADVTAILGAGARVDAVAASFAPFMVPSARPVLHYVLDRPGAAERTITVRGSGYSWPVEGPDQRDIQLQWTAADPVARDPTVQSATAWAGSSTSPGRLYPLTFNRIYPPGGSSPTVGVITSRGEVPVRPMLRIYGPITGPIVTVAQTGMAAAYVRFLPSFIINAGQYVDVDTAAKTAYRMGDPTQSVVASLDWQNSRWPYVLPVPPANFGANLLLQGSSTSGITQVQATWQDGYLS